MIIASPDAIRKNATDGLTAANSKLDALLLDHKNSPDAENPTTKDDLCRLTIELQDAFDLANKL